MLYKAYKALKRRILARIESYSMELTAKPSNELGGYFAGHKIFILT